MVSPNSVLPTTSASLPSAGPGESQQSLNSLQTLPGSTDSIRDAQVATTQAEQHQSVQFREQSAPKMASPRVPSHEPKRQELSNLVDSVLEISNNLGQHHNMTMALLYHQHLEMLQHL